MTRVRRAYGVIPRPQLWRLVEVPLLPLEQPRAIIKLGDVLDGFEWQLPRVILLDDYGDDDEKRGA